MAASRSLLGAVALLGAVGIASAALMLRHWAREDEAARNAAIRPPLRLSAAEALTASVSAAGQAVVKATFCANLFPKGGGEMQHSCADGREACNERLALYKADPRYEMWGSCEQLDQANTPTVWTDADHRRLLEGAAPTHRGGSKRCGNSYIAAWKTCHK